MHPGQPRQRDQDELYTPISGEGEKDTVSANIKPFYWGLFDEQKKFHPSFEGQEVFLFGLTYSKRGDNQS